jgi:hypothetical protein
MGAIHGAWLQREGVYAAVLLSPIRTRGRQSVVELALGTERGTQLHTEIASVMQDFYMPWFLRCIMPAAQVSRGAAAAMLKAA